jgi:HEAT repeat protein
VLSGVLPGFSAASDRAENGSGSYPNDWQTKAIASEADLDRVIAQLQVPSTRFGAILTLLDFAGWPKGNFNRDLKGNALHDKAIKAMQACPGLDAVVATMIAGLKEPNKRLPMIEALLKLSGGFGGMSGYSPRTPLEKLMWEASQAANEAFDVPTVEKALGDPDWYLRLAAVGHFGNEPGEIGEWKRLLPRMEELGAGDDESVRGSVAEKLRGFPGTEAFLAGRETNETSPNVLLELVRGRYMGEEFQNRFLTLFVPLLSSRDETVREGALIFIACNSGRAPMLQFAFGMDVFERVIASTKAKSAKERWMAAAALKDIRQINPDRSRETFLHLVNDPDENVRTQVAGGFAGQLEREDVKRAIAALLKDNSPRVRYM